MIGIEFIATHFPKKKVTIADLIEQEGMDVSEVDYFESIGLKKMHQAENQTSYDMALEACKKLLETNNINKAQISAMIHVQSRLPESLISSELTRLQYELDLPDVQAMSIGGLGCTDMSMALKLGKDHLLANPSAQSVLISYGSQAYTPSRFRTMVTAHGDGGVAALISRCGKNEILDVEIKSNGKFWDLFKVDHKEQIFDDYKEVCRDQRQYGFELAVESRNVFSELNNRILNKHQLSMQGVDHILLQNISSRAYDYYEEAFAIKFSPVCLINLKQYGHLGPMDVLLNYLTGLENGLFHKDSQVLIMNNSPAAAWSSILIKT